MKQYKVIVVEAADFTQKLIESKRENKQTNINSKIVFHLLPFL